MASGDQTPVFDALFAEATTRYKAEHERHGQLFARIGVYFVVLAIYGSALVRLLDKPPAVRGELLAKVFLISTGLGIVTVTAALGFLLFALAHGRGAAYSPSPKQWSDRARELAEYVRSRLAEEGTPAPTDAEVESAVAVELKQDILSRLEEAADFNIEENERRFKWLYRAGVAAALAAIPFFVAAGAYLWMMTRGLLSAP